MSSEKDPDGAAARRYPVTLRRQALIDLDQRTRLGAYAFLVSWLVITATTGVLTTEPVVVATTGGALLAVLVTREITRRSYPRLVERHLDLTERVFVGFVIVNTGLFMTLTAAAEIWPPLAPAHDLLVVVGALILVTATVALAPERTARVALPATTLGPYLLWLVAVHTARSLVLALLGLILMVYLWQMTKHMHDDYWTAARATLLLEERAEDLARTSTTDPLTGVANRLAFDVRFEQEWQAAGRVDQDLSLLLLDIDHFKRVNDVHGHQVGDACLAAVAEAVRGQLDPEADLVARYGGEEFVILLPALDEGEAAEVAERVRRAVAAATVPGADGEALRVTCSIGVTTTWPPHDDPPDAVVARADRALYQAKAAGRDLTVRASSLPAPRRSARPEPHPPPRDHAEAS